MGGERELKANGSSTSTDGLREGGCNNCNNHNSSKFEDEHDSVGGTTASSGVFDNPGSAGRRIHLCYYCGCSLL